ncbi:protein activator of alkane oxidation PraB [Caulobacter sp. CCNWLY153]|uniref:Protein activator of alkane oxidation PraB n=1 Tax=Caulobacter radicis TaxID=2172650 RepID=A0A2T9IXB5_9CAUL|nr:protein activator of alkane oxidation PraB [Caulobacter radicis]PVM71674.1 protein activator of alkane oxidation PraB [Caulobacter radicis]
MSKAVALLCAVALAAAIPAASATAANFVPNPRDPVKFTGNLTIEQGGVSVTCSVLLDAKVVNGGFHAEIRGGSFSAGDWQCGWLLSPTAFSWYVYPDTTTQVLFSTFSFNTILGSCSGPFFTGWANGSPGKVVFSNTVIPGSPGACTVNGTLDTDPSLTIV